MKEAGRAVLHRLLRSDNALGTDLVTIVQKAVAAAVGAANGLPAEPKTPIEGTPDSVADALAQARPVGALGGRAGASERLWLESLSVTGQPRRRLETVLSELNLDVWSEFEEDDATPERTMRFHALNHEALLEHFPNAGGAYLDGTVFELHDVWFQLPAVTSVSAPLASTLGGAAHAVNNFKELLPEIRKARARVEEVRQRLGREPDPETSFDAIFDGTPASRRSLTPLFQGLTANTHPYLVCREAIFEILAGRTLDTWDLEYLRSRPTLWGRTPLELPDATDLAAPSALKRLGPRWAAIEWSGPRAATRILSYHDCLARPETSPAVVLDTTHARFFGRPDWFAAGAYHEAAEEIRAFASGPLSDELGRDVRPHEVATVLSRLIDIEDHRRMMGAGEAIFKALSGGARDLAAMSAFFSGKEDTRQELGSIGNLGETLEWLVGGEPELEFSVAPHGRGSQGELRLFSFVFEGRRFVFFVGEDTLGSAEVAAIADDDSEEAADAAVCEALLRVPGLLGAHGAVRLRTGRRVWRTARLLAEQHGFAPWDTDALQPYVDRMGGTFPVVSTYTEPLAESCGFDEDEAASLIEGVVDDGPSDEEDRDVMWTLLFLMRDDQAPPADYHRATIGS